MPSLGNSQAGMATGGSYSLCELREGGQHQGHSSNFIEKRSIRKIGNDGGKTKRRGKLTALIFCREVTGEDGGDEPLLPLLTEGGRCHECNSDLIGKRCHEKNWEWWGKIKERGKPTAVAFFRQVTGGMAAAGPCSFY